MSAEHTPAAAVPRHDTTARMQISEPWRTVARAGWVALAALTVGLFIVGVPHAFTGLLQDTQGYAAALEALGLSEHFFAAYVIALEGVKALAFAAVAFLIFWRKPDRLGLFVSLMLLTFGLAFTSEVVYRLASVDPVLRWVVGLVQGLGNGLLVVFLYVFPDGRFVPRWTRPLAAIAMVFAIVVALPVTTALTGGNSLSLIISLGWYVSGVVAQTRRQRHHASPSQQQQMKWVLIGLGATLIGSLVSLLSPVLVPSLGYPTAESLLYEMFRALVFLTIPQALIPITIGFSILRYRLWEVDVVLNRSVVYGVLTALLAVVFLGSVFLLQTALRAITGSEQASPVALAISALVIGTLFLPARRRLQDVVDRRLARFNLLPDLPSQPPALAEALPYPPGVLVGARIGPYEVLEPLGRGGMAEVYKGRHTALERPVAIKVLLASMAAETDFRRRFEREAQTVAALKHPNVVQVFDFGEHNAMYYMVMEYVAGQDLSRYLRESDPLPLERVCALTSGIASALDYAHAQGVIHRDVKPSNVMLQPCADPDGLEVRPVLTDFGIAKIRTGGTGLTKTGTVGTLDYMAPEQIISSKEVDGRADIYSLGVMLYQMLTGKLPFGGDNPGAVVLAHLQQPPPDPRKVLPALPEHVALAVMRAMEKDPVARFATAGALVAALG